MSIEGPIVIVEDDAVEYDQIKAAITDVGYTNETRWFKNGSEALEYLLTTPEKPFLILADMLMPVMNGLELLSRINKDPYLHKKAIPFVFLTVGNSPHLVEEAYDLSTQGYFLKPHNYDKLKDQMKCILNYWYYAKHPNNTL